jgi:hypothetical protein
VPEVVATGVLHGTNLVMVEVMVVGKTVVMVLVVVVVVFGGGGA